MLAVGWFGKGNGLLALTNHRLLFLLSGRFHQHLEDLPLDTLTDVQWTDIVITGTLTICAGDDAMEINQIRIPDGRALSDRLRARIDTTAGHDEARSA